MKAIVLTLFLATSVWSADVKKPAPKKLTNEQILELKNVRQAAQLTNASFQLIQAQMQMLQTRAELVSKQFAEQSAAAAKKEEDLLKAAGVDRLEYTINLDGEVVPRTKN